MNHWSDLPFWNSGELQVVQEKLSDLESKNIAYCPDYNRQTLERDKTFKVFDEVPFDKVRVVLLGQDPYPNRKHATGIPFEVPESCAIWPQTLAHIFREYCDDLHHKYPTSPRLTPWLNQGVLPLNTYYTCLEGEPGSHLWPEYEELTKQVLGAVADKAVCVFMGGKAHKFAGWTDEKKTIKVSHPSPLGVTKENPAKGVLAFKGSRIFSKVNALLVENKQEPVDWKLP